MGAKMAGKKTKQYFKYLKIVWVVGFFVIGFGNLDVADARYLPTRRSEPNSNELERLSDLIRNVSFCNL